MGRAADLVRHQRRMGGNLDILIEHLGKRPAVDAAARIAPTAVICGDVTVGPDTSVGFGAVLTAESGPIVISRQCVIMENAGLVDRFWCPGSFPTSKAVLSCFAFKICRLSNETRSIHVVECVNIDHRVAGRSNQASRDWHDSTSSTDVKIGCLCTETIAIQ
jgi:hypothetical protein